MSAKVKAAPHYLLCTTTADTPAGEALLKKAISAAEESLRTHGGKCVAGEIIVPEQDTLMEDSD